MLNSVMLPNDSPLPLAKHLIATYGPLVCADAEDSAYQYTGTRWQPISDGLLKQKVIELFETTVFLRPGRGSPQVIEFSSKLLNGIIEAVKVIVLDPSYFLKPAIGVAFQNGLVRATPTDLELVAHLPSHRTRNILPYDFDPRANEPTKMLAMIGRLFHGMSDQADRIALLQEFYGACLLGIASEFQHWVIMPGSGGQGKSTVLEILADILFTPEEVTAIPPQKWAQRFSLAEMEGKKINFVSELPTAAIKDTNELKRVVTGNIEMVERKYRNPRPVAITAGHIMACNQLPRIDNDNSDGMWRRVLVLETTETPTTEATHTSAELRASVEDEKAAIALWALRGAQRLLGRPATANRYTQFAGQVTARQEWRSQASSPTEFVMVCCTKVNETCSAGDLYQSYLRFCTLTGERPKTQRQFATALSADRTIKRTKSRGYSRFGLKLLPERHWSVSPDAIEVPGGAEKPLDLKKLVATPN